MRVKRKMTPLLMLQLKVQQTRLKDAGTLAFMDSLTDSDKGSFYSQRFK